MKSQSVKLGKLCKIQSGGTPRRGVDGFYGGNILWAKIGDIENAQDGYILKTVETITPAGLKSINNKIFSKNTVLLAMYGSVGKTSIAGVELATNQAILGLHPNDSDILDFKYLRYWLDFSKNNLISKARGVALQNISATIVKEFEIPLLSLEDQKRIVKILDEADALRQKRKQAIGLLDDYLKSVFLEMFGDPVKNPKGWAVEKLGKITNKITDGTHKTPDYKTEGVKFISAKNIKEEEITWTDIKYISESEHRDIYRRCNPERNDLLLTKSGSLGMVALVDVDFEFSLFESLALLKINQDLIDPVFLREYLNLKEIKSFYSERTKGVGVKHLHLIDIKSMPILIPPKEEQKKFVSIVKQIKSTKQTMLSQSAELETQFQALMQKAFKGKL